MELTLTVIVDPTLPPVIEGALAFETGASPEQVRDVSSNAYNHHGPGFRPEAPGALARFYEDLLLGRPFPLAFATHAIADVDVIFAIALFLHRELAIQPATPATVATVDTAHRLGFPYMAHLDPTFARFLRRLRAYFPPELSKRERGERMGTAVGWVRSYIMEGKLPHVGGAPCPFQVIDKGTNGFVFAVSEGDLQDAWAEAYRAGFLRGIVLSPPDEAGYRRALANRKSPYLDFDLGRAAEVLNEMERAMGEDPGWVADALWLHGPKGGTILLPSHILDVLLRV